MVCDIEIVFKLKGVNITGQPEFEKALDAIEEYAEAAKQKPTDPDKNLLWATTIRSIAENIQFDATLPQYKAISNIKHYAVCLERWRWEPDKVYIHAGHICYEVKNIRKIIERRELNEKS
jgi:hypothetical protein